MAYLDSSNRPSPASMAAVIAIHGAVGAALIFGLTISGVIKTPDGPITTVEIKDPPPPEPPTPQPEQAQQRDRKVPMPIPPTPFADVDPKIDTTNRALPSATAVQARSGRRP